jgi:predicted metal-binding membrane protein
MRASGHRNLFLPLMGLLIASAWLTLWLWAASPYGRYLDHGSWLQIGLAGSLCRALPAGEVVLPALIYVGGWLLMSAAMMLPTTLPLLEIFRRISAARADRALLLALVIAGYLAVWGAFGVAAHLADLGLHALVGQSEWLTFNGWLVGAGVLALAGLFQFSALKYRCLDACRTPQSFVIRHWQGSSERRHALLLGAEHGLYCVGCCWALMLLMFVVGMGSVGWMLLLGAVMAAEKNLPWGRRLSAPIGIGLLACSTWLAVVNGILLHA